MAAPKLVTYFKTFTTDALGQIFLTGIVDVSAYSQVNVEIIQWPHAAVTWLEKTLVQIPSGSTLAQVVGQFPLGTAGLIHTFNVIGPEFSVVLTGGTPTTDVPIQAWLFLR